MLIDLDYKNFILNKKTLEIGSIPKVKINKKNFFELKNKLKCLVIQDHRMPIVNINLKLNIPPIYEGNKVGIKSIFGDMLRSGTKKYTKEKLDKLIDYYGTSINISSKEIFMSCLKEYLDPSLEIMGEICSNPTFDNNIEFKKIIKKRIVALEMIEKDFYSISLRIQNALYYGKNHPYGEYETFNSLNNISIQDLKNFYDKYFNPKCSCLVFIGDITKKEAKNFSKKYFINWKNQKNYNNLFTYKEEYVCKNKIEINLVDFPIAVQSFISVGKTIDFKKNNTNYFPCFLANEILGGNSSQGRLFLNLREKHGYTYGIYSNIIPDKYKGIFFINTQVSNIFTSKALKEILKEIKNLSTSLVSYEELEEKKREKIGNFILFLEEKKNISDFFVKELFIEEPKNFYKEYFEKIYNVKRYQILNAAKKILSLDNCKIIIIGKKKEIIMDIEKLGYPIKIFDIFANNIEN
jgi:zinc protease